MRGTGPCRAVRARGVLGLMGTLSPSRVMRECPLCPRRCAWYEEYERRLREALGVPDERATNATTC